MNIFFVSLGCDKNLVDSEEMLGALTSGGYRITDDESKADVIIINTCCFIHDAKEESIQTILEMASYKEQGNCKALIVTGCLAQRYKEEITQGPKLMDEVYLFHLHHADHGLHPFDGLLNTIFAQNAVECGGKQGVVGALDVFAVEPLAFDVVKLGSALGALREVELLDEFLHGEQFLVCAGVPSEQGKEVDDGVGQVSFFAVARRDVAALRVVPLQGEYGEAEAVAVALGELSFAIGLEQQGQVGKGGHGVGPAECAIEEYVERGGG